MALSRPILLLILLSVLDACHPLPLGRHPRTLEDVMSHITPRVQKKVTHSFKRKNVSFPPDEAALLAFKKERKIELWVRDKKDLWTYIRSYPIQAASGTSGPKLHQGDKQVPEGIYKISSVNPNSQYHLSMKLNYPNPFDLSKAKIEKRKNLGGDIYIHGQSGSSGCLAMGNRGIEPLFYLVAKTGPEKTRVVIAPHDLRKEPVAKDASSSKISWIDELYGSLKKELDQFL